jgi:Na+/H+ antiporter NhaC
MLSLGAAMETTGTDKYLAGLLVHVAMVSAPLGLLAGFFLLTVALTQPMSNQAAAAVLLPVAVETADQLALKPARLRHDHRHRRQLSLSDAARAIVPARLRSGPLSFHRFSPRRARVSPS